ncbi:TPA: lysozyme inhibitor LprI family protein [Pseudomonas putida]
MTRYSLAAIVLACCAIQAQAEAPSSSYSQCMDKAMSTLAMSNCIVAETQVQDERLNRVYKQLMAKLEPSQQKALRDVQRTWIKYRDENCAFHGQVSGGTARQLEGGMCLMDLTRERAVELERVLSPAQ